MFAGLAGLYQPSLIPLIEVPPLVRAVGVVVHIAPCPALTATLAVAGAPLLLLTLALTCRKIIVVLRCRMEWAIWALSHLLVLFWNVFT